MSLTVISVIEDIKKVEPAAMYAKQAARYINIGINEFRIMVRNGIIPARKHAGRKHCIYLKSDLDEYLGSLPKGGAA